MFVDNVFRIVYVDDEEGGAVDVWEEGAPKGCRFLGLIIMVAFLRV